MKSKKQFSETYPVRNPAFDEFNEINGTPRYCVEIQLKESGDVLDYIYFESEEEANDFIERETADISKLINLVKTRAGKEITKTKRKYVDLSQRFKTKGKLTFPRQIILQRGFLQEGTIYYCYTTNIKNKSESGTVYILQIEDIFDFVNEMLNDGHTIKIKESEQKLK